MDVSAIVGRAAQAHSGAFFSVMIHLAAKTRQANKRLKEQRRVLRAEHNLGPCSDINLSTKYPYKQLRGGGGGPDHKNISLRVQLNFHANQADSSRSRWEELVCASIQK
jgi:hypothetical protein